MDPVANYLAALKDHLERRERKCWVCHGTFVGVGSVCGVKCQQYAPLILDFNREYVWRRPIGPIYTARKTILVERLPDGVKPIFDSDLQDPEIS